MVNIHDWLDSLGPDWEAVYDGVTELDAHVREVAGRLAAWGVPDGTGGWWGVDAEALVFIEVEGHAWYRGSLCGLPEAAGALPSVGADGGAPLPPFGAACVRWAVFLGGEDRVARRPASACRTP
jgi:hypothetical protein